MLDTIQIGTSGMLAYAEGLRVVSNNLSNVNTTGFKGSQVVFSDLIDGSLPRQGGMTGPSSVGQGVASLGSSINFSSGADQQTGNPLDLALDGGGFFTVRRGAALLYTRAGQFHFDEQGTLVNPTGDQVLGLDSGGDLAPISLTGLEQSPSRSTTTITFAGNLSSAAAARTADIGLGEVAVIDADGAAHTLTVSAHDAGAGSYAVSIVDPATGATVGGGVLAFSAGFPTEASKRLAFTYTPPGGEAMVMGLDFSSQVTLSDGASTLRMLTQDGYPGGTRTAATIGADGTLRIAYSNGTTAGGPALALARFVSDGDLDQVGGGAFKVTDGAAAQYGYAASDGFGTVSAGHLEGSNVNLAGEFSSLIVMQRGYQASSHAISSANEMIQELFDMKGHR